MNTFKKSILLTFSLALTFMFTANLSAQDTDGGSTGLGVMIGEPTGISLKSWTNNRNAFDLGLAWSLSGKDAIHIHADYLWHKWLDVQDGSLAFYYGVGGRAVFADDAFIGLRIPFGLNYLAPEAPIGFFVEVAPIVDFLPDTDGDANGGIGVRYYF